MKMKTTRAVIAGLMLGLLACLGLRHAGAVARAAELQSTAPSGEAATSRQTIPGVERRADRILREMGAYLGAATEFTFHADVTYDSLVEDRQMLQYGGTADVSVLRPDRIRAEYRGDERQSSVVFDGRTATIHDLAKNVYSVTEVPAGIDAAVDHLFDTYGFSVPIADLVYADAYRTLTDFVDSGFWVGLHSVDGTPCHHLAFSQETLDWQIWIDSGPRPLPRKLVITYKDELGSPQYTARLSRWDLQPRLSNHYFEFHPPIGADEIEFLVVPADLPAGETEVDE